MPNDIAARDFRAARGLLLKHRDDLDAARRAFVWPRPPHFNWALDYFDPMAAGNDRLALWIVDEDGAEFKTSFAEMRERSNRAANFLRGQGVGDPLADVLPCAGDERGAAGEVEHGGDARRVRRGVRRHRGRTRQA